MADCFEISVGEWCVWPLVGSLPRLYSSYVEHAVLCDEFDIKGSDGDICFLGVGQSHSSWPTVIVAQRFQPGPSSGFTPGAHIAPSTATLFVGAGERLLAYDLREPCRKWEDYAEVGFWSWKQHGDVVLMASELELAAWSLEGSKLWSRSVEPPWEYAVSDGAVSLDIMGSKSTFALSSGPPKST